MIEQIWSFSFSSLTRRFSVRLTFVTSPWDPETTYAKSPDFKMAKPVDLKIFIFHFSPSSRSQNRKWESMLLEMNFLLLGSQPIPYTGSVCLQNFFTNSPVFPSKHLISLSWEQVSRYFESGDQTIPFTYNLWIEFATTFNIILYWPSCTVSFVTW